MPILIASLKLTPQNSLSYYNRGVAKNKLGEFEAAIADFNKAIELKSDYTLAYYSRSACYMEQGKENLALNDFKNS